MDGRILVSRYEPRKSRLADTPALVLEGVQDEISNGTVEFAVAENGTLVYQPGQGSDVSVVWVDRTGRDVPVDTILKGGFSSAVLSPDGSQIALARSGSRGSQIWVKQLRTGAFSPISQELQDADRPVWTRMAARSPFSPPGTTTGGPGSGGPTAATAPG